MGSQQMSDNDCGSASFVESLPPGIEYLEFDPNPVYIHPAIGRCGVRGRFSCNTATREAFADIGRFDDDLAVASLSETKRSIWPRRELHFRRFSPTCAKICCACPLPT